MRKNHLKLIRGEKKERTPFQKLSRKITVSLLLIILVFFLARAVFLWGYGMAASYLVSTVVTEERLLEEKMSVEGVIIRDEKVITSPREGYLVWALDEGTRVGVGRVVAEVVSQPPVDDGIEGPVLEHEEKDITNMEEKESQDEGNEDVDSSMLEDSPDSLYIDGGNEDETLDLKEIEYQASVMVNRLRKAIREGNMEEAESYYNQLESLSQEQLIVHSSLQAGSSKIISPFSGIVSYYMDGLEDFYQPSLIHFLSSQQLKVLNEEIKKISFGEKVGRGSPIFKIVDNYTWYFTVPVTPSQGEILQGARRLFLRFDFISPHDTRVEVYHLEQEEDKTLVTFKVNEQLDNFYLHRQAGAEVIYAHFRGITVPEEALVEQGEEIGVYTIEKAVVRFRPVEIKRELEGELVVEGLPAGRVIIQNPRFFRQGQYIPSQQEEQEREEQL